MLRQSIAQISLQPQIPARLDPRHRDRAVAESSRDAAIRWGWRRTRSSMSTLPTYRIEPPDVLSHRHIRRSRIDFHLSGRDGTINLGSYGQISVAGKTISESRDAVQGSRGTTRRITAVDVDVFAYNSKFYYVVTEGSGPGDTIQRVPITGNETVLDAITQIGGLTRPEASQVWIAASPGKRHWARFFRCNGTRSSAKVTRRQIIRCCPAIACSSR